MKLQIKLIKIFFLLSVIVFESSILMSAKINGPVPAFELKNSHKEIKTLNDYKGKILFINFWASWCAPCQVELPQLDKLAGEYEKKNFSLIAINVDKDPFLARKILDKTNIGISDMEILWDTDSRVVKAFNIDGMPTSIILDSAGKIRFIHNGFHQKDPQKWREEINRLMNENPF